MGFDSEIIGGSPFQLPTDYRIGSSYIAFVGATWLAVVSAIVAGKMCLPRFVT
jgi:lariat debranching enzyme